MVLSFLFLRPRREDLHNFTGGPSLWSRGLISVGSTVTEALGGRNFMAAQRDTERETDEGRVRGGS